MKKKMLKDYLENGKLNIDKMLDDFYGYVYIIVKNGVSSHITDEDIEEIISDVFVAIWKNSERLSATTDLKAYLAGTAKNRIKNKYRKTEANISISEYEEKIIENSNLEKLAEENEQSIIIKNTLKTLKIEEYEIFIMFYCEAKPIKEIAEKLKFSTSKVKVILHRVRKKIKRNLEDGGYGYER